MLDIYRNIKDGVYENKVSRPRREDFNVQELVQTKRLGEQIVRGFDEKGYREAFKKYREAEYASSEQFKHHALKTVGLEGHPKAEKCWDLMRAHSGGESLLVQLNYLEDFAELVLK